MGLDSKAYCTQTCIIAHGCGCAMFTYLNVGVAVCLWVVGVAICLLVVGVAVLLYSGPGSVPRHLLDQLVVKHIIIIVIHSSISLGVWISVDY